MEDDNVLHKIAIFLLIFLFAFRGDDVGGDTIEYCNFYRGVDDMYGTWKSPNILLVNEPGLSWLCAVMHLFNDGDAFVFLFLSSLITLFPFLYFTDRYSNDRLVPILLFMILWGILSIALTGLRQVLGVSFCLISYIVWINPFIQNKYKNTLAFILLLFALTFHSTILIAIPLFYSAIALRIKKKTATIAILATYFLGATLTNVIPFVYNIIGVLFEGSEVFFRFEGYFTDMYELSLSALGLQQLLISLLICIYCFSLDELYEEYGIENGLLDKLSVENHVYLTRKFQLNCLILGCACYNLFAPFPNAGRFFYPFFIVGITSSIPQTTFQNKNILRIAFYGILVVLSLHEIYAFAIGQADRTSDYYVANQMFPYLFIWE